MMEGNAISTLTSVAATANQRQHDGSAHLGRLRWAVRAVLTLGVAASIAANILHAAPSPVSRAIAAWPPLALLLTVELISRVPVHRRGLAVLRLATTAAIAGIAAWVSYWHMAGVASRYGETDAAASYLLPLSVDGLVVVASINLVEIAELIRTHPHRTDREPPFTDTDASDGEPHREPEAPACQRPLQKIPTRTAPQARHHPSQTVRPPATTISHRRADKAEEPGVDVVLLFLTVRVLRPALQVPDVDANCDTDSFIATVREMLRARATPSAAVYIAWDAFGRCRYVGSVRRPSARATVRDRLREHLGHDDRRAGWYALTVLPLRPDLDLDRVRLCEGWVARLLAPLDGSAHPMISAEPTWWRSLSRGLCTCRPTSPGFEPARSATR